MIAERSPYRSSRAEHDAMQWRRPVLAADVIYPPINPISSGECEIREHPKALRHTWWRRSRCSSPGHFNSPASVPPSVADLARTSGGRRGGDLVVPDAGLGCHGCFGV